MNSVPAQHGFSIPIRATVCLLGIAATLGAFEPPKADWDDGWFDGDGTPMRLKLAMGGEVRGRLLSFTDHVIVIEQGGFPHAVAYQQMETGCAYRTKKAMLSLRRGGAERLWAVDRYALGMLALDRERYDLAVREFAEAGRLDESYQSSGREALERFGAKPQAKDTNKRRGIKSEPTSPFAADSERNTDTLLQRFDGDNTGVDPNDPTARAKIIEGYKRVGNQIRERLGGELALVETAHFLIWTDWPSAEHSLLGTWAEQMYSAVASLVGLSSDDYVFAGKCPLFCMRSRGAFRKVAKLLDGYDASGALGYTSTESNGHVHVVLYRYDRSASGMNSFAGTLVHEGTHAFLHRYRSTRSLPDWIDEGLADFVAEAVLQDRCTYGEAARAVRREIVRGGYDIEQVFEKTDARHYAVAHSLVSFLIRLDEGAFVGLINDIKSGAATVDALYRRYSLSPKTLDNAWRRAPGGR